MSTNAGEWRSALFRVAFYLIIRPVVVHPPIPTGRITKLLCQKMVAELQYDLTRRQRLIPHIRAWGLSQLLVILGVIGVGFAVDRGSWWIALFAALFVLWFGLGYLAGLWNVLFVKLQHMDIVIEDKGLGYMVGKERWYIFLDGLTAVRDLERTVWTIQHWNGTVVNIPKTMLSEDALNFLRDWVRRANDERDKLGIRSPYPTKQTEAQQAAP